MRSSDDDGGETFTGRGRRAQLVACALDVVAELGYAQASIARIADRAGISKTVVLHYFPTKDALVLAVVTDVLLRGARAMLPAIEAASSAREQLAAYIRANCRFVDAHRRDSLAVLDLLTGFRDSRGRRVDEALAASPPPHAELARLDPAPILRAGVEAGELTGIDPDLAAVALRAAIDGMVFRLPHQPDLDVVAYGEQLVTLFGGPS